MAVTKRKERKESMDGRKERGEGSMLEEVMSGPCVTGGRKSSHRIYY